jgi:hypothetical protein
MNEKLLFEMALIATPASIHYSSTHLALPPASMHIRAQGFINLQMLHAFLDRNWNPQNKYVFPQPFCVFLNFCEEKNYADFRSEETFQKSEPKKIIPKICLSQNPMSLKNGFWGFNFFLAHFISKIFLQI